MQFKTKLMDEGQMDRSLMRISHEILEREQDAKDFLLIGIRRRGVPLAEQIAENLRKIGSIPVETASIDITLYRDDRTERADAPEILSSLVPESPIEGKDVILVDDVIFTGRTIRAAMDCLMQMGRPKCIRLATLIDRGHRELPIRPDFVGKNVPSSRKESIEVHVPEVDGTKEVILVTLGPAEGTDRSR